MTKKEAKDLILSMDIEKLIDLINDQIDIFRYPLAQIKEIDDDDWWDRISLRMDGWEFRKLLLDNPEPKGTEYFMFDEDSWTIIYFRNKKDILDTIGIDTIIDEYLIDNE